MTLWLLVLALAAGHPGPDAPQTHLAAGHPGPAAPQSALDAQARGFARLWSAGDVEALSATLSPQGIRLHLLGEDHRSLPPRQARAALRDFLARYGGGEAWVGRVSEVGGTPPKGFADLRWQTRQTRTGEAVTFTLFVGFVREGGAWVVSEVRVLP